MRKKYSEEQILKALGEASSGIAVSEVCRKYGVSEASFYKWRSKYGGADANELRRLRELEVENRRLKKAVADLTLDVQMLKEVNSKNW